MQSALGAEGAAGLAQVAEEGTAARRSRFLACAGLCVLLVAAASASGSYFPGAWGWLTLAAAWGAALVVALRAETAVPRGGLRYAGLLAAFAGWSALSTVWSSDVTQSALEARRVLVYAAVVGAVVLTLRGAGVSLLHAVWVSSSLLCLYGLGTRVLPDRLGVVDPTAAFRLSEPVGYWNGLGMLAVVGFLLALWIAARGGGAAVRAVAGASVVPLLATLYFTYSRGAWIAAVLGVAIGAAFETRRTQVLVHGLALLPFAAAGVLLSSRETALTTSGSTLAAMAHQGHRLTAVLVLLALAAGGATLLAARLDGRVAVSQRAGRAAAAVSGAAVVVAAIAVSVAVASPWTLAERGWHRFSSEPPTQPQDLNHRLTLASGGWRTQLWSVGGGMISAHPLLGEGAGTFPRVWVLKRPNDQPIRDAHSLYLQTLAELGPLGLLLLLAALAVPLAGARCVRGSPLAAGAVGAFAAYVLHTGIDWEWQIPAVTLPALLCGAAILVDGNRREYPLERPRAKAVALAGAAVVAALGIWGIAEQTLLSRVQRAARHGNPAAAASDARRAADLEPWSTQPWQTLGEAQRLAGDDAGAAASFQRALAKDGSDWQLWLDLAYVSKWPLLHTAELKVAKLNPHSPELADLQETIASLSAFGRSQK